MSEKFTQKELEQYLAGKMPLHADRLVLPEEEELAATEAEFDKMVAHRKRPVRHIPLWPWVAAAAAMVVVAYMLWPAKPSVVAEDKPARNTTSVQVKPAEQIEAPKLAQQTPPKSYKPHKFYKSYKPHEPPLVKPELAQTASQKEEPVIPPDKQALADIFLAEEALQVAYQLQAQQEAIRAYAASLTGQEQAKPIIAF